MKKVTNNSFNSEVLESRKPALVDFYADWCPPCMMLAPLVEKMDGKYGGVIDFCKLNTDNDPELAMRYGVNTIPTLIVFKNGSPVSRNTGYMDERQLEAFLADFVKGQ